MTLLISKVQYQRSEKGEFHDVAERSLADTIFLVLNYPWATERSLADIKLSCPSVTIENPIGTYLKIGPYFSGKFSLYYLDTNDKVYLKVIPTLEDAVSFVQAYFEQKGKLQGFEKYGFVVKPSTHFRTNPFEYTIGTRAIITFFRFPIYMMAAILLMLGLSYLEHPGRFNLIAAAETMLWVFLLLWGPLIYLFFDYLLADENNYIQISRGHEEFVYGTIDNKKTYSKQDIVRINAYGLRYQRSLWSECEVFIITFKNGEQIKFTSLLISSGALIEKFHDRGIRNNKKFFATSGSVPMIKLA
ncbi:hypothetical protein H9X96_21440 [Pedobacter sp. N36a]|uniref:hypothetical protein n=1 Tax=Pedobacter sp. N36a TaxID=2767996 RepID=UPI001656F4DB|nr:hypothetical protein [Pedobacter sp. N36a]MBC8988325.1 hypothetical protein [Pedobacter sp. N36a]